MGAEVICKPNNPKNQKAGTNVQKVKKQNQQSKQAEPGQYGTEFAEETDAQYVKKQNRKSQQKKSQQSYHVQENTLSLRRPLKKSKKTRFQNYVGILSFFSYN